MPYRPCLWFLLAAVCAGAADAAPADPLRLQFFSGVDRQAVAVGETVNLELDVLAVPGAARHRARLVEAFARIDLAKAVGADFEVVGEEPAALRVTGTVVELRRTAVLRVVSVAAPAVPPIALAVDVDGRTWEYRSRSMPLQPYLPDGRVAAAARSVVSVVARGAVGGVAFERLGSAFLVGDDALVTAYHVVAGARRVRATLLDGREVDASRVWVLDPVRDVAVLHVRATDVRRSGLRPLTVAPREAPGPVAFTAGWPARRQRRTVAVRFDDLGVGGQRLRVAANAVQPGDSGGPLLDETGRVLGVVVSGRTTRGTADLLRQDICLASDPGPALRRYRSAVAPVPLRQALRAAVRALPAAQAHEAVGAIQVPRQGADRRPYVDSLIHALRRAPHDPVLQFLAGSALEEVGEMGVAAGALDASRRAGYVPAAYSLAHHLLSSGRLAEAAELFAEMAGEGPYAHLGAFGQAQALVALGRHGEAERALEIVLGHDAHFAPALYLLGLVRLNQEREAEAAALAVRLAARPEWAGALRIPVESPGLRMPVLRPLPRTAMR